MRTSTRVTHRNVLDDKLLIGTLWGADRPAKDRPADHYPSYLRIVLFGGVKEDGTGEKRWTQSQGGVCCEDNALLLTIPQEPFLR